MLTPALTCAALFMSGCRRDLVDQGADASFDLVADGAHGVDALSGRDGEVPVEVARAGEDGAGVAAAHRDDQG